MRIPEVSPCTVTAPHRVSIALLCVVGALGAACGSVNGGSGQHESGGTTSTGGTTSGGDAGVSSGGSGGTTPSGTTTNTTSGGSGTAATSGGSAGTSGGTNGGGGRASSAGSGGKTNTGGANTGGTTASGGATAAGGVTGAAGTTGSNGLDHGIQGVYCGNSTDAITQFETWLGKPTGGILGYTGNASWSDYDGSVGWAAGLWGALDRRVLWSVPLIPTGANLADAAAGMYDDHYRKAAQTLAKYRPQESVLYVRTGWEFNGDWFPWTAQNGKAKDFAGAFQHFVAAFRKVSSRFRFEWNVNLGDSGMNPEDAYPGDANVDIVGMDFYWNLQWDPADPNDAWNSKVTQKYGLKWHQDFATAHHKPTAYSEWGIMSDKAGPYIQQAKAWFAAHDVVYQTYWNSNAAFSGMLSQGQYPNAGAAYKAAFGP